MKPDQSELDDILNSLNGIEKAVANPFLFEKVKHRMESRRHPRRVGMTLRWAMLLAAVIILNVLTWTKVMRTSDSGRAASFAAQLGFTNTSYQY